jgi:hypothetical protein
MMTRPARHPTQDETILVAAVATLERKLPLSSRKWGVGDVGFISKSIGKK